MQTSARNGAMVAAMQVCSSDEMMLITDRGTLVRTRVEEVSISSRNTQGVTLIRLGEAEALVKTVRIQELEGDDELDAEGEEGSEEAVENSADDAAEGGSAEPGDDSAADDSNTDNND